MPGLIPFRPIERICIALFTMLLLSTTIVASNPLQLGFHTSAKMDTVPFDNWSRTISGITIEKTITVNKGGTIILNPWDIVQQKASGFSCVKTSIVKHSNELEVVNGTKYVTTYPALYTMPGFSNGYYYTYNVKGLQVGNYYVMAYVYCYKEEGIMPAKYIEGDYFVYYHINVVDIPNPKVISIDIPSSLTLTAGQSYTFSPVINEAGANTTLIWASSNPSVASVTSNGMINANNPGSAVITCTASNGVTAHCNVIVDPLLVENIELNFTNMEIAKGQKCQIQTTIYPWDASIKQLSWQSFDENVAVVDNNGIVTGVSLGSCQITATTTDGSHISKSCFVKVCPPVLIESMAFESNSVEIMKGRSINITPNFQPANASFAKFLWISNRPDIAQVDQEGRVTGMATGHAIITASTTDGSELYASCDVYVMSDLYEIEYLVDGEVYQRQTYRYGQAIDAPEPPSITGYSFLNWKDLPETMPMQNLQVEAALKLNKYLLTYKFDDIVFYKKDSIEYNAKLNLENVPEKEGYSFNGWTVASCSEADETAGMMAPERMPAHDLTLNGYYNLNNYLLTYMVDSLVHEAFSVPFGSSIPPTEEPTREGYIFSGWDYIPDRMPANDVTVTGYFTSALSNVIYINPTEVPCGQQTTLSLQMKNTVPIRGFQFDLYLPERVTPVKNANGRILGSLNAERLPKDDEHTLSISEQADGSIRFLCGSQYDETFTGNDGDIISLTIYIPEDMADGEYPIMLKNIKMTETDISKYYETSFLESKMTIYSYIPGDINGDGKIDVSDYIGVANYIIGNTPAIFIKKAADVDGNNKIDVSDYIGIANFIMTGTFMGL